jgi:hypothetical protein
VREEADDLDRLYAAPLGEFTAARAALAARLRRDGRTEAAAEVARLKKPSAPVWAVNQLARRDRVGVERLVQATEQLRAAQLGRAGGEGSLADATERQRAALAPLLDRATAILADAGLGATAATRERVSKTLLAAAIDPDARADLRRGRLSGELEPPGFEVFAGVTPARPRENAIARRRGGRGPRAGEVRELARERERVTAARQALQAAQTEARTLADRAAKEAARAAEARRAADEAARAADRARQEAEEAAAAVRKAEAALRSPEDQQRS